MYGFYPIQRNFQRPNWIGLRAYKRWMVWQCSNMSFILRKPNSVMFCLHLLTFQPTSFIKKCCCNNKRSITLKYSCISHHFLTLFHVLELVRFWWFDNIPICPLYWWNIFCNFLFTNISPSSNIQSYKRARHVVQ